MHGGSSKELPVGGVFIFIGFVPNSDCSRSTSTTTTRATSSPGRDMQSSVDGIWAVGDVRAQLTKQIATAVGDGTTAAVSASAYVSSIRDRERTRARA